MIDQDSELDQLYAVPLDQFIKVRNDLAGRLRKEGDQEGATRIAALKKPSVSAWVVNQLARTAELDLQRLIKAGEALEQAQRRAISGQDSTGFEAARRDEGAAMTRLRTAAGQVLSASPTIIDRVVDSLRSGAATKDGRDLIKRGRLTEDMQPPGFDAFSDSTAVVNQKAARSAGGKKQQDKIEALRGRKAKAEDNAKARAAEAGELEDEARKAEVQANKLARAAAMARKQADEAASEAQRIDAELADLEQRF